MPIAQLPSLQNSEHTGRKLQLAEDGQEGMTRSNEEREASQTLLNPLTERIDIIVTNSRDEMSQEKVRKKQAESLLWAKMHHFDH